MNGPIRIAAFYRFFTPSYDLQAMRLTLKSRMQELGIKGTILLAKEGINGTIAGPCQNMEIFLAFLQNEIDISLTIKESHCSQIPFKRTLVKIKPAIVCEPSVHPVDLNGNLAPYLSPEQFNEWIQSGQELMVLDTRNDYEYKEGHFKNSVHLGTRHFADFEKDINKIPEEYKNLPIITFCTGGIRCEKAAPLLVQKGFKKIYQLEGGILNYFEKVGRGYFEGNCFVFDERISLDETLSPVAKAHE